MLNDKFKLVIPICYLSVLITVLFTFGMKAMILIVGLTLCIPLIAFLLKNPKRLVYFQLIYVLIIKLLISDFHVPSIANYVTDIINVLIFIFAIRKLVKGKKKITIKNLLFIIVILMFLQTLIGIIINGQDLLLYVWGIRNLYRFFIFLFGSITLLQKEDIEHILKILYVFLFINVIICSYQYFILKLGQDYVSGTFGTLSGGNGYMNMFLVIIATDVFIKYQNQNINIKFFAIVNICLLYIATISELKMFYIEFVFIIALGIMFSKPNKRTFTILLASLVGLYLAIQVLYIIYPGFRNFFNLEYIMEYSAEGGYSNEENLNRFTAISTLDNKFFKNTKKSSFIGLGTGSAEISQFSRFNSEFASIYAQRLAYNWFSHAFMFIENGYIGLTLYTIFFIMVFIDCYNIKKIISNNGIIVFTQIISIHSILLMWYNSSLRMESAYIWFLVLGFIYINLKEYKYDKNKNGIE